MTQKERNIKKAEVNRKRLEIENEIKVLKGEPKVDIDKLIVEGRYDGYIRHYRLEELELQVKETQRYLENLRKEIA